MQLKLKYLITVSIVTMGVATSYAQTRKELSRFDSIAHMSARIAQKIHYTCSNFDDTFSKSLFSDYLESLDNYHAVFLQEDIAGLKKKYEMRLDNEFNGAPLRFFPEVEQLFRKRLKKSKAVWEALLSRPLDLTKKEQYKTPALSGYPASLDEQKERWCQVLTMLVENEMYAILSTQSKDIPLAQLQQKARTAVARRLRGYSISFLDKMDHEDYFSNYMDQFCSTLDAHSAYLDEKSEMMRKNMMAGMSTGIGVMLNDVEGRVQVTKMVPGGPAALSGKIRVGDVILTVKQEKGKAEDISGYNNYFVSRLISGQAGTELTLGCERPDGSRYSITLNRAWVARAESKISTAVIEKNGQKTGYILLPVFYGGLGTNTGTDVSEALTKLQNENVSSLVIDLRNNPGGVEDACIAAMGQFLSRSPVFQRRKKDGGLETLNSSKKNMNFTGSLVLLVNPATMSCGDMFAQVMQEYGRALIMGAPTGGKGVGQAGVSVSNRKDPMAPVYNDDGPSYGKLLLTTVKFYGVTGNSVQQKGVMPDVLLPDYLNYSGRREAERKYAIAWDSIPAIKHPSWNFGFDLEAVKKKIQAEVNHNAVYQQIAKNEAWLKKNRTAPVSLNWDEYVTNRKEVANRMNESAVLSQLKTKLSVRLPAGDNTKDKEGFLNRISADIYINTATDAALELLKTK